MARVNGQIVAAGGLVFVIGVLAAVVFLWTAVTLFHPGLTRITETAPAAAAETKVDSECRGAMVIDSCNAAAEQGEQEVHYFNVDGSPNPLADLIGPVGAWGLVLVLGLLAALGAVFCR